MLPEEELDGATGDLGALGLSCRRAGIEGTNSELKRAHGLGRLRVRGGLRVRLAVYLKALACNIKRMVRVRLVEMEKAAQGLAETIPAVATP